MAKTKVTKRKKKRMKKKRRKPGVLVHLLFMTSHDSPLPWFDTGYMLMSQSCIFLVSVLVLCGLVVPALLVVLALVVENVNVMCLMVLLRHTSCCVSSYPSAMLGFTVDALWRQFSELLKKLKHFLR